MTTKRAPLTPLKKSNIPSFLSENDDAKERAMSKQHAKSMTESPLKKQVLNVLDLYANVVRLNAENKITQKNSWTLGLIDHMDDVINNNDEDDGTMNFQKASATLEASTKIYSCRVDAVHSETYRVLGGLNRGDNNNDDGEGEMEDGDANAAGADAEGAKKKRSAAKRAGTETLESNLDNLNMKKIDVESEVDPLFHKTSASFSESNTSALLLNTLQVGSGTKLIFDSQAYIPGRDADVHGAASAGDESRVVVTEIRENLINQCPKNGVRSVEIWPAFKDFVAYVEQLIAQGKGVESFMDEGSRWAAGRPAPSSTASAAASAAAAALSASDKSASGRLSHGSSARSSAGPQELDGFSFSAGNPSRSSNVGFGNFADDDDGGYGGGFDDFYDDDGDADGAHVGGGGGSGAVGQFWAADAGLAGVAGGASRASAGGVSQAVSSWLSRDVARATHGAAEIANAVMTHADSGNEYCFFDARLMQNWAGPTHWKRFAGATTTKKVAHGAGGDEDDGEAEGEGKSGKRGAAAKKAAFVLDFLAPDATDYAAVFAHKKGVQIILSNAMLEKMAAETNALPDDLHFNVSTLARLFNRPSRMIALKSKVSDAIAAQIATAPAEDGQWFNYANENDRENFVPDALNAVGAGAGGGAFDDDDDDMMGGGGGGGFDADDDDLAGPQHVSNTSQVSTAPGQVYADLQQDLVNAPVRVGKIDITYSKIVKKVDVKQLKETIWSTLQVKGKQAKQAAPAAGKKGAAAASQVRLHDVIDTIEESKPKDSAANGGDDKEGNSTSVPFYFICLLHLANEHQLQLSNTETLDELFISGL